MVVYPIEGKTQQGSIWTGVLKGAVQEGDKQRDVRRMFKMLRKV